MKKLMFAVASAMAVGLTAQAAETWFDAKIDTYTEWPTNNAAEFKGEWSNTESATLEGGELKVSADESAPLTFEATDAKTLASDTVAITSALTFTPFENPEDLPEVPDGAKAGVIACGGYFYVLAKGEGEDNVWTKTDFEATEEEADVTVTFADGSNATYKIGENTTNVTIKAIETVNTVCMSGDGAISALSSTAEAKSVGPTPAPGSDAEVTPAGDNTYIVTPGSSSTVAITGVKNGDTLIIVSTQVDALGFNSGVNPTIVVKNAKGTTIPNDAFYGLSDNVFNATLNPDAEVDGVKVQPAIETSEETPTPFVVDTNASTTVKTIVGLTYNLVRDNAPDGTFETTAATEEGTGDPVTLTDSDKPEGKAFYKVQVTK